MDIIVDIIWHVVVYDVRNFRNVETSCSYRGCYEDGICSSSEVVQGLLPFPLKPVSVDAGSGKTFLAKVSGEEVRVLLNNIR